MTISKYEEIKEEMLSIASRHGLKLDPDKMKMNESGMDFLVSFATDDTGKVWVLRRPRRPDVWERSENERSVLQLVRRKLSIAVPEWRIYTPELIAYPMLGGDPVANVDPAGGGYVWQYDQQALSDIFFDSLAKALSELHQIDHASIAEAGARIKSPDEARAAFLSNIEEIKESFIIPAKLEERWQAWLSEDSYWPEHSTFNHGDLHPPHILVDNTQRVTGLIDWTEAECADPGKDFVIFFALFGEKGLRDLLRRYERYGGRIWSRMHEHIAEQWAAYPALVAKFALTTGQESDMEMARGMLASWNTT